MRNRWIAMMSALMVWGPIQAGNAIFSLEDIKFQHLNDSHGLSQNGVSSILQDHRGFLWLATRDGLNRYDGFRFKIYQRDFHQPNSLPENQIETIVEDKNGLLWIGHQFGLACLDPETDLFTRLSFIDSQGRKKQVAEVNCFLSDRKGRLWVGTGAGIGWVNLSDHSFQYLASALGKTEAASPVYSIVEVDGLPGIWVGTAAGLIHLIWDENGTFDYQVYTHTETGVSLADCYRLAAGKKGTLWVSAEHGFFDFQPASNIFTPLNIALPSPQAYVTALLEDRHNLLWIGTDQGIGIYNRDTRNFTLKQHNPSDPQSLSASHVWSLFEDEAGIVWIGTFSGGLNKYNRTNEYIAHEMRDPGLRNHNINSIFSFYEDGEGFIWVGAKEGGISRFDRSTRQFKHFDHPGRRPHDKPLDLVFGLRGDGEGNLWLATVAGLYHFNVKDEAFSSFLYHEGEDAFKRHRYINVLYVIEEWIWAGTDAGLARFEPESGRWTFFGDHPGLPEPLRQRRVIAMVPEDDGWFWLGTNGAGLVHFRPTTGESRHFPPNPAKANGLSHGFILSLIKDRQGRLWIGTLGGGLNRFNPEDGSFTRFTRSEGLINEKVFSLVEDLDGLIWLGTNRGVSRFDPKRAAFKNLGLSYNLQGNEYCRNAAFRSRDGILFMGGINGFNMFDPTTIQESFYQPRVSITGLKIRNQPVTTRQDIGSMEILNLKHSDQAITFQFAALDYFDPGKNRFFYKVEGLTDQWVSLGEGGELTFPRLAPGSYQLRVRATNHEGYLSKKEASLRLWVKPPWWRTLWAYSLYFIIAGGLIWFAVDYSHRKVQRAQEINAQLRQADRLKDEFLANVSHELRTPLHGMIGLTEGLIDGVTGELPTATKDYLAMIVSCGKRLAHLVNDILDYQKLRNHELEFKRTAVDMRTLTDLVIGINLPMLKGKALRLINKIPADSPLVGSDENRLQQILHNLIGNAVKFTRQGEVEVLAGMEYGMMVVSVRDSGIGIPEEAQQRVFDSFEQLDGSTTREYGGTGLGLAISKKLVELLGGRIWLESVLGQGSTFSFTVPLWEKAAEEPTAPFPQVCDPPAAKGRPLSSEEEGLPKAPVQGPPAIPEADPEAAQILVVDDDPLNRQIMLNHLRLSNYHVSEACSGPEALDFVKSGRDLDLILLDVMMPRMTGFEVCRELRKTFSVHELPVIFLTAKDQESDLVKGFESGANDYLGKPISKQELLSRVKTHIQLRHISRNLESLVHKRTRDLADTQKELLEAAHTAGMAEIASEMLHNAGNTLNSLITSIHYLGELSDKTKYVNFFQKVHHLLEDHLHDLGGFFSSDPRGKRVPEAVKSGLDRIHHQNLKIKDELSNMNQLSSRLKAVLTEQQSLAHLKGFNQQVQINEVVEEALRLGTMNSEQSEIKTDLPAGLPEVSLNRTRLLRVIHCILHNANEAFTDTAAGGTIWVQTLKHENELVLRISDNGIGIAKEDQTKIYQHGYTSKKGRHGFGLHYCANAMQEMSGGIDVFSDGIGKGTRVELRLPLHGSNLKEELAGKEAGLES